MSKKKIGGLGRGLGALIPGMENPVKATAKEKKAEPEKTREVIKEVIKKIIFIYKQKKNKQRHPKGGRRPHKLKDINF